MSIPVRAIVPLARVESVPCSSDFYARLGFEVKNTFTPEGEPEPTWAWLLSGGGAQLMISKGEPVSPSQQGVLFYLYCDDVAALREELVRARIDAGPIRTPFYAPRGEFEIRDPDGYVVMVTHT